MAAQRSLSSCDGATGPKRPTPVSRISTPAHIYQTLSRAGKVHTEEPYSGLYPSIKSSVTTESISPQVHGPKWRRYLHATKWFLIDQWFLLALGCLIIISSQVQVPASRQSKKELVVTYLCVAVIFFITGCTLPTRVLLDNYTRVGVHVFVQVQCFLMTSAVTYGVVSICATNPNFMSPGLLIGMIFTGCVPTTISSNVIMTKQAHGNQALTVVQSTLGNFLGPFFTPLLITMYTSSGAWYTNILPKSSGGYGEIYQRVFKQLGLSIFLPLFVGQIVQHVFPKPTRKFFIDWHFNKLGSLSLLIIIWQTFDQAFSTKAFSSVKGDNIVFIVFMSISFYTLWVTISVITSLPWLSKRDTIAVAYCVPAKTPAMGVPLSHVMFTGLSAVTESEIQIPMVLFQGIQIVAGSLLTIAFRKWMQPDEDRELTEQQKQVKDEKRDPSSISPDSSHSASRSLEDA